MKYEIDRVHTFPKKRFIKERKWKIDNETDVYIYESSHNGVWISADMIIAIANQLLDVKEYNPEDYEND